MKPIINVKLSQNRPKSPLINPLPSLLPDAVAQAAAIHVRLDNRTITKKNCLLRAAFVRIFFSQKGNSLKFLKYWFPVVIYCSIIFGVSAIPNVQLPQTISVFDKLVHMCEYAILAILFARAIRHVGQSDWLLLIWVIAVFFVAFYGITDEFHQSFVAGRSSDLADWLADIIGGGIGAAVYLSWKVKSRGIIS